MISVEIKLTTNSVTQIKLEAAIRSFRFIQNKCLNLWEISERGTFNKYTGNYCLPKLREDFPFLYQLNAQSCQVATERAWLTIAAFYRRCKKGEKKKGYPKYKKTSRSFELTKQSGWKLLPNGKLKLTNIGTFKIYGADELYVHGVDKIQRLQIIRKADGYYCQFILKVDRKQDLPPTGRTIGLDLGLNNFYVDSNGESVECPQLFRKAEQKLKKLNRQVSRKVKGSNNRKKAVNKLARKHLDVQRQRKDFVSKLARCVVKSNDFVAIENLNVQGMKQYRGLSKSISDAGWYSFRVWLEYYAKVFGRVVSVVNPAYTSQDCSACGDRKKKLLSERTHTCTSCGLVLDRDHNAAINILKRGLSTAGQVGIYASGEQSSTLRNESNSRQDSSLKEESYSSVSEN